MHTHTSTYVSLFRHTLGNDTKTTGASQNNLLIYICTYAPTRVVCWLTPRRHCPHVRRRGEKMSLLCCRSHLLHHILRVRHSVTLLPFRSDRPTGCQRSTHPAPPKRRRPSAQIRRADAGKRAATRTHTQAHVWYIYFRLPPILICYALCHACVCVVRVPAKSAHVFLGSAQMSTDDDDDDDHKVESSAGGRRANAATYCLVSLSDAIWGR